MPYLSFVVTARNDNHGGDMLRRMQIFVNGLIEQSRRHRVEIELMIVEWNPPGDRPKLVDALTWNLVNSPCTVRIIEVPPELHQRLNHAEALPLFQMIAKNVGIRRAQGQFVVATNIDLLFSDALFAYLATHPLAPGNLYRANRVDVRADIPLDAPLDEQFAFCEQNILRINHKDGILILAEPDSSTDAIASSTAATLPSTEALSADSPSAASSLPTHLGYKKLPEPVVAQLSNLRRVYQRLFPRTMRDAILRTLPPGFTPWLIEHNLLTPTAVPEPSSALDASPSLPEPASTLAPSQYPPLHTMACGDFTLLAKEDWFAVRGYPEWEMYSLHIDSVFLYIAHYAGCVEVVLPETMCTYHMEHSSGWTPKNEPVLEARLAKVNVPRLDLAQLDAIAKLMAQTQKPLMVNLEPWGMAQHTLPETQLVGGSPK
jgi:hypothetical protein